jgi:REP element-mobilizing transposase RayT
MTEDWKEHHRRSIRLPGYDYASAGFYFVTVCVRGGKCLLGKVVDGEMRLNEWGQAAWDCGQGIHEHFPHVALDAFVVMPNHVHAIVALAEREGQVGAQHAAPLQKSKINVATGSLGAVVRSFKAAVTKQINELRGIPGTPFWQRNYWEHIIRDEASLNRIREYIEDNPARWADDQLHPNAPPNRFNQWPPR